MVNLVRTIPFSSTASVLTGSGSFHSLEDFSMCLVG
jgi:hypothetical protein